MGGTLKIGDKLGWEICVAKGMNKERQNSIDGFTAVARDERRELSHAEIIVLVDSMV